MISQITENLLRAILVSGVWITLIFLAHAPGRKFINLLTNKELTHLEKIIFSVSLGLGFIASGFILLGLTGLLKQLWMIIWILVLAVWSRRELFTSLKNIPNHLGDIIRTWREANYQGKGLIFISGLILFLTYLQALTPPWDEDGLMYHMEGPRIFLEAGRILFIPENYQANFPMLPEMLYAMGIGIGVDQLAKLIQLTYAVLLVLATYALGERLIGNRKGWLPAAILISTPMVIALASFTYTDLTWALYTLISVYTILIWYRSRNNSWLVIAGIFSGFMIGSKYLGLGYLLILAITILWIVRKSDKSVWIKSTFIYGGTAFLIGGFWYLKNFIWIGNPVYPFFFGGFDMSMDQVKISSIYLNSFGTGKQILDYLLLPVNIFLKQQYFATYLREMEIPNPLFLLVIFIPLVKRKSFSIIYIFTIVILGFVFWALGTQQNRLLLPLFPFLSILSALILFEISLLLPKDRLRRVLIPGILGGWLIFSLIVSAGLFGLIQPQRIILGKETPEDFLLRLSGTGMINYNSMEFIQTELSSDDKVLMIWSRQIYYCQGLCIPDTDHSLWPYLFKVSEDMTALNQELSELGITHILISNHLMALYMPSSGRHNTSLHQAESNLHNDSYAYLVNTYIPACTEEIYRDDAEVVYELKCLPDKTITSF
jgi:hypothetical protein